MNDTHSEKIIPGAAHEGQLVAAPDVLPSDEDKSTRKAHRQWLTGRAARNLDPKKFDSMSPAALAWRELKKNRLAMLGLYTLIVLYTIAIFGQFIAPYDSTSQTPGNVQTAFQPPMRVRWVDEGGKFHWHPFVYQTQQTLRDGAFIYLPDPNQPRVIQFFVHGSPYKFWGLIPMDRHLFGVENGAVFLLGTDGESRDYFTRLLYGSMISLSVGFVAISISFTLGLLVGGISGFYGGLTDDIIMRGCEIIMSVPDFYLLLALAAALPADLNPIVSYLLITSILSFIGWAGMARIIRGMVLSVREREYVEAGRALGLSDLQIIVRHILPSTFTYAIVAATMSVPGYILAEAGLSFLGLGIRDPVASWGNMLTQAQNQTTLISQPWILTPGLAIFITTIAFNFLGDGLRDALDPKSRRLG